MSGDVSTTARVTSSMLARILDSRHVTWILTALFAAVGLEAVFSARYLHDEGLLTYYFAAIMSEAPLDVLFWQKARPVIATVHAPFAALGFRGFAVVHVLLCAATIPALASVAKQLGQRCSNVAAFVFASSPLMLIAAPAGCNNTDALCGLVWALWLLGRERRLGAGALLGSLVLIRSEVAVFVLAIALERALAKDRRTLLGLLIVPGIYVLTGAIYHHDLLWNFHYPPTLMAPTPTADWIDRDGFAEQFGKLWEALMLLSPAILVALLVRPGALRQRERTLGLALLLFLGLIRGFPLFGLFNFDASPRYLLVAAPALALVVGRVVDDSLDGRDGGKWTLAVLLGLLACGFVTIQRGPEDLLLPAVAISAIGVAMIRLARPGLAIATWSLALLASSPVWPPRSRMMPPRDRLVTLERAWVELQADAPAPVVTNVMLLSPWLEHRALLDPEAPTYYLLSPPQLFELDRLIHAEVGQDDAILEAFGQHFYGRPVLEHGRDPSAWPPGTIVMFKLDGKRSEHLDLPSWRTRLDILVDDDDFLIGRVVAEPGSRT